jgi:hypothetical protein
MQRKSSSGTFTKKKRNKLCARQLRLRKHGSEKAKRALVKVLAAAAPSATR